MCMGFILFQLSLCLPSFFAGFHFTPRDFFLLWLLYMEIGAIICNMFSMFSLWCQEWLTTLTRSSTQSSIVFSLRDFAEDSTTSPCIVVWLRSHPYISLTFYPFTLISGISSTCVHKISGYFQP